MLPQYIEKLIIAWGGGGEVGAFEKIWYWYIFRPSLTSCSQQNLVPFMSYLYVYENNCTYIFNLLITLMKYIKNNIQSCSANCAKESVILTASQRMMQYTQILTKDPFPTLSPFSIPLSSCPISYLPSLILPPLHPPLLLPFPWPIYITYK